ncbi:uncharacterized protein LOC134189858 [Corticium candelabrum]|uniref:uncharacterized protein LOC134189858 n=1 Tax=Corticium candelabrum TaxID=121492 RepID=UPI002E26AEDF|nr:uncharacterized protein LOC134189858 [Corticium candelabrum]
MFLFDVRYNIASVVDVSNSMQESCLRGSVLATLAIASALEICSIDTFCVFAFADRVTAIKPMEMQWDDQGVFRLLTAATNTGTASVDADCLRVVRSYLENIRNGYPNFVLMFTDGFGSCGNRLREELIRAWKANIQVIGIGLGLEQPVVDKTYYSYVTAATASHLPEALRSYAMAIPVTSGETWYDDKETLVISYADLDKEWSLLEDNRVFDNLIEELGVLHEVYVEKTTNLSPTMQLDICYVIDGTGSMSSYIRQAKDWIVKITNDISSKMSSAGRSGDIQVACVLYRSSCCRPHGPGASNKPNIFDFMLADQLGERISDVKTGGGCGSAADVIGGLKWALQQKWRPNSKKILIEMGDQCPHGSYWNKSTHKHDRSSSQIESDKAVVREIRNKEITFMFSTVVKGVRDLLRIGLRDNYNDSKKGYELEELDFSRGNIKGPGEAFKHLILDNVIKEIL